MDNNQIIAQAVSMAGPMTNYESRADYDLQVDDNIRDLVVMFNERSDQNRLIDRLTGKGKDKVVQYIATVGGLAKEESSTRAVLTLISKPSADNEKGLEHLRTERTDSDPHARNMARYIGQELIGHRVLVFKEDQTFTSKGKTLKMRTLIHIVDLGDNTSPDIEDRLDEAQIYAEEVAAGKHKG